MIETLLKYDPDVASTEASLKRQLPLHLASCRNLEVIKLLFDAYPEAIWVRNEDGDTPLDEVINRGREFEIRNFLEAQLAYAREAKDMTIVTTPDEKGWLPLHHALEDNAPFGSIKLLLKGNPSAVWIVDNQFAFPLHIACEFSSARVVKLLVELDINGRILDHCDTNKNSILHYACRGGNLEVVNYLLDKHVSLVSSAEVNQKEQLPLHLLCEAGKDDKVDIDSVKYTETIWLMLLANPEALVGA